MDNFICTVAHAQDCVASARSSRTDFQDAGGGLLGCRSMPVRVGVPGGSPLWNSWSADLIGFLAIYLFNTGTGRSCSDSYFLAFVLTGRTSEAKGFGWIHNRRSGSVGVVIKRRRALG